MDRIGITARAITRNYTPQTPCSSCAGSGGSTASATGSDGVTRSQWIACGTCHGSGMR